MPCQAGGVLTRETSRSHWVSYAAGAWAQKVLAGVLALTLVRPWGRRVDRRLLSISAWVTGALLTLYGAAGLLQAAAVLAGVVSVAEPADRTVLR
jgi:hypothetical protein